MPDKFYSCYNDLNSNETAGLPQGLKFIGDVASKLGITPVTIRFYEREGLVSPRRIGRFRAYGAEQEARLRLIAEMRSMGFSIVQIKEMLEQFATKTASTVKQSYCSILSRHLDELRDRQDRIIRETELTRARLNGLSIECAEDAAIMH